MPGKQLKKAEVVGKRIYLRLLEPADSEEFIVLNRASRSFHRGLASPPVRADQFDALLERSRRPDTICFVMCRVDDDAIVGSINLSQIFLVILVPSQPLAA
jgi:RimJ/RimL family protein N-acetyltransferase